MWDYDEAHSHILIDGEVGGSAAQAHHPFRPQRLPLYVRARQRADACWRSPMSRTSTGRRASTRRPASRSTTIPSATSRSIPACRIRRWKARPRSSARRWAAATISGRPLTARRPSCSIFRPLTSCNEVTLDPSLSNKAGDWKGAKFRDIERIESDIVVADPFTGEIKKAHSRSLSELQRHAHYRRRPRLHRLYRRHVRRLRRHDAGAGLEDQRRHRLQRAADDLRGRTASNTSRSCRG